MKRKFRTAVIVCAFMFSMAGCAGNESSGEDQKKTESQSNEDNNGGDPQELPAPGYRPGTGRLADAGGSVVETMI